MKKILSAALVTIMALSLTACGSSNSANNTGNNTNNAEKTDTSAPSESSFPKMEITIATTLPNNDQDAVYAYCSKFAEVVTEKTGGAVTFDIQGDGILGNDTEIAEGIVLGTLDMGVTSNAAIANYDKTQNFFALPFLFENDDEANSFIDSDIVAELNENTYDDGIKILNILDGGFRVSLNTKHSIGNMNDYQGMKWRVPPMDLYVETFNALGANATPMSGAEVFTGLQQKTIDGCEFPVSSIYSMQLYTAADYIDLTNHMFTAWYMCLSDDLWEELTPELQQVFVEAGQEANETSRKIQIESVESQLEEIEAAGCTINRDVDVSAMREAVKPVCESYRDEIGAEFYDKAMEYIENLRK